MGLDVQVRVTFRERSEYLLAFDSSDSCAKTVVDTGPKRHVGVGPAGDVHHVWIIEFVGVTVGRRDDPPNPVVLLDGLSPKLHFLFGDTGQGFYRGIKPQALLGGPNHHALGIGLEQVPLVPVLHQRFGAIANEINGGLMAGNQQQRRVGQRLLTSQNSFFFAHS